MARTRDAVAALAGLAALTTLMGRKKGKDVPVEDRKFTPVMRSDEEAKTLEDAPQSEKGKVATASPAPARAVTPKVATGSGRGGVGGPRIGEREAYEASKRPTVSDVRKSDTAAERRFLEERQRRMETPGSQAVEQDLDVMVPLPGIRRVGRAAKALAEATPRLSGPAARPLLQGPARQGTGRMRDLDIDAQNAAAAQRLLTGPAKREALEGPPKRELLEYDPRKARAEAMEGAKPILQARPGKPSPRQASSFKEDEMGVEFKKGGRTKKMARGGVAKSSASKRADGIAVRGKTRCKVY